jgi:hypothetical protein
MNTRGELIYLAVPYSHADRYVRVARWIAANKAAAKLMALGLYVFSPISHTHPIAEESDGTLPRGWDFWEGFDRQYLNVCKKIIVLRIPGWDTSTGVTEEIKIGTEMGIPVEYMDWDMPVKYENILELCKSQETLKRT